MICSLRKTTAFFILTSLIMTTTSSYGASKKENEPPWVINPFAKDNPQFYGGTELFASSRVGQVYAPGAGVTIAKPLFMLLGNMAGGSKAMVAIEGLSSEYIAHVAWRLGCDQGNLQMRELKFDEYPSLSVFLNGGKDDAKNSELKAKIFGKNYQAHPLLAEQHNQTINPLALMLFGTGQVMGQRYFGPWLTNQLAKAPVLAKNMGPVMSKVGMDLYGWPTDYLFTRAQAIGKVSGILMGTWLAWSLNDYGWQLAHWRKSSLDTFSNYFPYFGNDNFGSYNGLAMLGFTLGGMYGHNLGSSIIEASLRKWATPGGALVSSELTVANATTSIKPYALKTKGTILKHSGAIAGNIVLGLTLTTYFPHLYKKIFHKFDEPKNYSIKEPLSKLSPDARRDEIKRLVMSNLGRDFNNIIQSHKDEIPTYLQALSAKVKTLDESIKESVADLGSGVAPLAEPEIQPDLTKLYEVVEAISNNMYSMMKSVEFNLRDIKTVDALKSYMSLELTNLIPVGLLGNKDVTIKRIVDGVKGEENLEKFKKRFAELLVAIYPMVFKFDLTKTMAKLVTSGEGESGIYSLLRAKRDVVSYAIIEVTRDMTKNPAKKEEVLALQNEFKQLHIQLVTDSKAMNRLSLERYDSGLTLVMKKVTEYWKR